MYLHWILWIDFLSELCLWSHPYIHIYIHIPVNHQEKSVRSEPLYQQRSKAEVMCFSYNCYYLSIHINMYSYIYNENPSISYPCANID
jgi:hypothetical protein